jgi:hypothetical protein
LIGRFWTCAQAARHRAATAAKARNKLIPLGSAVYRSAGSSFAGIVGELTAVSRP